MKRGLIGIGAATLLGLGITAPRTAYADDDYIDVALDGDDADSEPDDSDGDDVPDHKGKAKKGWLLSCGVAIGAAKFGYLPVAGTYLWKCLKKKGLFEN